MYLNVPSHWMGQRAETNLCKRIVLILLLAVVLHACSAPVENATLVDSEKHGDSQSLRVSNPIFTLSLPADARLTVTLIDALDTDTNMVGDTFLSHLVQPVLVDGAVVLEKGTIIKGRVVRVQEAGRVSGQASIRLVLTEIFIGGETVAIITNEFSEVAGSTRNHVADIVDSGVGIGEAMGVGLATDVRELYYGPDIRVTFTLAKSVELGPGRFSSTPASRKAFDNTTP